MIEILFSKELFSAVALSLTFIAFYPYIRALLQERIRPHVFSWFIWGAGTLVVFAAQVQDGAGVGAWPVGISGLITCSVGILALWKVADTSIVRMDWVFLALAASALPLWYLSQSALSAVIVLTIVDLLGFGPSVRKAYNFPYEENASFFGFLALQSSFVIAALENYSWTTVLFPAAVGGASLLFFVFILGRRQMVSRV